MRLFAAIALLLAFPAVCQADVSVFTSQDPLGSVKGLVIDRPATEPYACGTIWEQAETPIWCQGLDITQDYPGLPDLVLAYTPATHSDNLRLRSDDARMVLGPRIGHPVMPFQLEIDAGTPTDPLGGLFVSTTENAFGLYMENRTSGLLRDTVSFQNLFFLQTDTQGNGTGDFWLYNGQSASPVFSVTPANAFTLSAPQEGFYGASPTYRPTVTGSWSDGSAAKSVLAALVKLGLVTDQTTP